MSWITTIGPAEADGPLGDIYARIAGPDGQIDNVLQIHSLRPHTLEAHMTLYQNVLHHRGNLLPKWLLETVGIYVSLLNGCAYCVAHHFAGSRRLLQDDARAAAIRTAQEAGDFGETFDRREIAILEYASALTRAPASLTKSAIEEMRNAGLSDGEILEANQVASYFRLRESDSPRARGHNAGRPPRAFPGDADDAGNWQHT